MIPTENAEEGVVTERDSFLSTALKRMRNAKEYSKHNREAFVEDMKFYNGEQWDTSIKQTRDQDGRPSLTLNQLPQFVDQIIGDIRLNRPRIKIRPNDKEASPSTALIYEGIIRGIEYYSTAEQVYDTAAESMLQGGLGAWRIITKYINDNTFNQQICIEWIPNPLSVYFDPKPYDLNKEDADWCFITERITKEEFKKRYPDKQPVTLPDVGKDETTGWFEKDHLTIAEYWYREESEQTIVQLSDGRVVPLAKAEEVIEQQKLEKNLTALETGQPLPLDEPLTVTQTRVIPKYTVKRSVIYGLGILEKGEVFPGKIIPIVPIEGKMTVVEGKRYVRGMVRFAKDAQRMYNYWRSAETEFVALQPKSPWLASTKQIEGHERDYKQANTRNIAVLKYNPDPANPNPPQRLPPPQASPGMFQGATQSLEDVRGTMGMHEASLGMSGNERTGKAIMARNKEGDVGNFPYVDNLCRALRLTGRILVGIIPKVYDTSQEILIRDNMGKEATVGINQPGQERGEYINNLAQGEYSVYVDTGPSYTTMRQEAAEGMVLFAQAFPEKAPLIADLVARSQDWEYAEPIAERLERTIPPHILHPPEMLPPPEPSPEEITSQAKAQQAVAKTERERLKIDESKLSVMKAALELQANSKNADVKKVVIEVLQELFGPQTREAKQNAQPLNQGE